MCEFLNGNKKQIMNTKKYFFKKVLAISSAFVIFLSSCPLYSVKAETVGAFTITGGTLNTDYEFTGTSGTNGVLKIHPQNLSTEITIENTNKSTATI